MALIRYVEYETAQNENKSKQIEPWKGEPFQQTHTQTFATDNSHKWRAILYTLSSVECDFAILTGLYSNTTKYIIWKSE